MGCTVAYIYLYGYQNYGLDVDTEEYKSDIDMKDVIVPTLKELVSNSKPVSEEDWTEDEVDEYIENSFDGWLQDVLNCGWEIEE